MFKSADVLSVFLNDILVGRLTTTPDKLSAFEYDNQWVVNGFSISPFSLPLEKKVFISRRDPFEGMFGVFCDSLPDGWGRLLIDRMLTKKRINPATLSFLDRLSIVGSSGMGALTYLPETKLADVEISTNLDTLALECRQVLQEHDTANLDELVKAGGSSGGARPKVLIKYKGEDWLVKFRSGEDPKNVGELEYAYSLAARKSGLEIPETKLFPSKKCRGYFGVKRFDRKKDGTRVHMLSASGLLETSHRLPILDYVDLMKATLALTGNYAEVEKIYRLMCFNVLANNRDDHSKNFSFLYDAGKREWVVSPAYDLVWSTGMGGEHATSIAGEGKNPTLDHVLRAAKELNIAKNKANRIWGEVQKGTAPLKKKNS